MSNGESVRSNAVLEDRGQSRTTRLVTLLLNNLNQGHSLPAGYTPQGIVRELEDEIARLEAQRSDLHAAGMELCKASRDTRGMVGKLGSGVLFDARIARLEKAEKNMGRAMAPLSKPLVSSNLQDQARAASPESHRSPPA